jgi:hypothetical protein
MSAVGTSPCFVDELESTVQLRVCSGRYRVECACIVEQSTILDFDERFASDDLVVCRDWAKKFRSTSHAEVIVAIWDTVTDQEVQIE